MKTLAFILVIMNNTVPEGEITYSSFSKCKWFEDIINFSTAGKTRNYSAYCKPIVITKDGE
jgi:hypothetical protein|tara:strand:- start:722 stop:904 length:183 start_codon:yes stop_codon:yes gene_type:complete